jgi:drug/metabolite transporter (DMT)-like permease
MRIFDPPSSFLPLSCCDRGSDSVLECGAQMDLNIAGESAAVVTSVFWTISSIFFTSAGRKIGSLNVNAYRTVLAVAFLAFTHVILLQSLMPAASNAQWFWMGLSGIVGLSIGDSGLFAAYITIGPRRSLLLMALSPIFAAVAAYLLLGEGIPAFDIVGMVITLAGVVIVILEREENTGEQAVSKRLKGYGVLFGLVAAAGQGCGLALAKKGIDLYPGIALNPLSATLMRMVWGAAALWIVLLTVGRWPELRKAAGNSKGIRETTAAAILGPFLGVTLSMVAVTYTEAGVAQTLLSLMPVMIIPVVWILYRQRTSWRGILGAVTAVIGVAILFLT